MNKIDKAINFLVEEEPLFSNPIVFDDAWLDKYIKGTWKRNSDGKIDITGNVKLASMGLEKLPYSFARVTGFFECSLNILTTLEGCPEEAGGFFCDHNKLVSLEHAPKKIGDAGFYCSHNQLTTLTGAPKMASWFSCFSNQLTSLEGSPEEIENAFDCSENRLTSLTGAPRIVKGDFVCYGNPLLTLKDCPEEVGGAFHSDVFTDKDYRAYVKEHYE